MQPIEFASAKRKRRPTSALPSPDRLEEHSAGRGGTARRVSAETGDRGAQSAWGLGFFNDGANEAEALQPSVEIPANSREIRALFWARSDG